MSKPHGIIIFGANGSGKTTLGSELARILNFKHMAHEAYAFAESETPYTNKRFHDTYTMRHLSFKTKEARARDFEKIVERLNNNLNFRSIPRS